jgi:hypothetical protein
VLFENDATLNLRYLILYPQHQDNHFNRATETAQRSLSHNSHSAKLYLSISYTPRYRSANAFLPRPQPLSLCGLKHRVL